MWVGHGRAPQAKELGHPMAELPREQGTPFWVPDSPFLRRPSTFRGVWRVKRPLNPTKQGPLRPYRRDLRNGSRITFIRVRCFEKSPENQGNALKRANRRCLADPRAPQQGSSAMWVGHGRAPQAKELGHPMAELPTSQGTPFWVPDSSFLRRPSTFRGVWRDKRPLNPTKQGPLRPCRRELRNGSRITFIRVRCFEKSSENQGNALKRANRRCLADPPAPQQGSSAIWVGEGRAPRAKELGHPMAELLTRQGTPFWVPDSSFLQRPSTFRGVWRVKRPLNPTKQGPLRPYRRDLRNGSRITFIRVRCFEKSPENQGNALKRANRRCLADPRAPQQGSSAMWVGHGRAPQAKELGHPMAELPTSQGTPFWVPDSSFLRRPSTFRGVWRDKRPLNPTKQGPLRPCRRELRNGSRITFIRVRCFEKSSENQGNALKRANRRCLADPPAPQQGSSAIWVGEGRAPRAKELGHPMAELLTRQGTPFWVPDSSFLQRPSTFRGVWRVKRPLNPTKQGPLRPYRRDLRNGSRITFIRVRCFEKSPENQGNALKRANRRCLADPRAPQQGSSAMWVGHGRAPQAKELGHPMAELPRRQGTPFWVPDSSFLRRSSTFRGVWRVKRPLNPTKQGPLRPYRRDLRNGSRITFIRVRCFEKSPENQGNALKRANRRCLADPRAPQQGSSAIWVGHGRAPQAKELGHPMAELLTRQGTPFWVPDSSFLRRPSTFRGVWRVKRPLNPTKQGPLRPYRRDLRNGSRITFIRVRCFEKSPENQGNALKRANRRCLADPRAPQQGSSAMWVGHGRAPQAKELGHPMTELPTSQGTPFWVPDSSFLRRPSTFRGVWRVKRPLNPTKQGPLRPYRRDLHNGLRITFIRVRCFEKSPENQGNALKRANRRCLADPRAPQQGSSAMWVGHGRAPQAKELGHPLAELLIRQGTPFWVPDSSFLRRPSTFRGVWRVKRPLNPMKPGPLRPYRRDLRNGSRITFIRVRCFEKSPENQ